MVNIRSLFTRPPAIKQASKPPADSPIAMYWDGSTLSPIKSGYFETSGEHSGFGPWLSGSSYREIGNNERGYAEAYVSCEWAFRALNVRTQKIASVMAQGVIQDVNGKPITGHPLTAALESAYRYYRQDIYKSWAFNKGLYGESYIQIVRAALTPFISSPRALHSLTPLAIEPVFENGRIASYEYQADDGAHVLYPADIIFDSEYNPLDEKRGLSLFAVALNSINIDRSIVIITKSYLKNNARPGIIFTPKNTTVNPADWDRMKSTLAERSKGPENSGKPLIVNFPMDTTVVQPPSFADQATLTEEKKRRICSVIGVPTALVDYTDMAFQLSEEQAKNFYDLTIIPAAEEMTRVVNNILMPVFDRSGAKLVLPIDTILSQLQDPNTARSATSAALSGGYLTLNEARKKHQEPEVEGGDIFFFQQGVVPIPLDQLANAPALVAASQPQSPPPGNSGPVGVMPPGMHPPGARPPLGNLPSGQPPARPQLPPGAKPTPPNGNMSVHMASFDQTPVSPVKQATPSEELAAWKRKAVKSGASKPFVAYTLPKHIEAFVRDELMAADTKAAIAAVFEDALGLLDTAQMKTYEDTRAAFIAEMQTVIGAGQADDVSRQKFAGSMKAALRRYGLQAFQDGITEGSEADHESFSEDELTIFKTWNAETADYISGLSSELYKEGGITEAEVDNRAELWANKSLDDIYYAGYRIGGAEKPATWHVDGAKEHCDTCLSRDGETKTMDEWGGVGFPRDRRLICEGWKCTCYLTGKSGNVIGFQP